MLEPDDELCHAQDLATGETDPGPKRLTVDYIAPQRERFPGSAENDFLVSKAAREANGVNAHARVQNSPGI